MKHISVFSIIPVVMPYRPCPNWESIYDKPRRRHVRV